ncbi:hypothetical protein [Yokenella regensburgei]|uniref:hypothetical protein n=1 Tax=Yokenella regensburgei TaxID=158877 RepID=UPI0013761DCE|nr:hypothetical protein [Yokenella regensburgei]KAF1366528.1 hypothetical protein FHR25_004991 [Yokenella regensburgei]
MVNPMIALDDRFAIRSSDIYSIEVVGCRVIVNNSSMPRYVLDKPDEASARDIRNQLLATIQRAERNITGIVPARYVGQVTISSSPSGLPEAGATNASTPLSSRRKLTPAFRDHLQALLDAGDCEAIVRAIESSRNAIGAD